MHRIFLAALALACVCSPAMALGLIPGQPGRGPAIGFLAIVAPASAMLGVGVILRKVGHARWSALFAMAVGSLTLMGSAAFAGAGPIAEMLPVGGNPAHGLAFGLLLIGALALAGGVCLAARVRLPILGLLVAALIAVVAAPALAAELATTDATRVTLSAAPWIELVREIVITAVIPAVAAYAIQAIRKVYPWAALFLTQARVEQMANAVTEYAINAVPGAVKEGKLSINVGSAVIAKAVQRAVDAAPAKALEAAGGQAGLAEIVFRKLNLEDDANEGNTLAPVVASLPVAR